MFVKIDVLLLFAYGLTFCDCLDDEWSIYENSFKNENREEIFVANATANSNFKSNFTVARWKTLTVGATCYTGGITDDSKLVILFSTLSENSFEMVIDNKIFDLKEPALDFEFFHKKKNGKDKIMLVVYVPVNQEFLWYTLDYYFLNKVWTWSLEKDVSHFSLFKIENRNIFLAITTNKLGTHSADLYEFTIDPVERWFCQSIPLRHAANSSCLNNIDSVFYLSIPQTSLNQLQIYQFSDNHFTPYQNLSTPKMDQVVCFENGFKSFIAFNGLEAGIYEFTEDGITRENIVNSNLKGIQFWLPIPVNTYRDETILLCQRKLDHGTHFSFDVDVVTYNGNRFEEHEDIPCLLFGEQQTGLKCLTDYDHKTGIMGSSYIAVADHLSLVVPTTNSTSLLFDLNIGIRKVEHPAKKDFESYLGLKEMLQTLIDDQNKELAQLREQSKKISDEKPIFEKYSQQETADSVLKANPPENVELKIFRLRDEIEQVVRDIENLNERASNRTIFEQPKDKFTKIIFNGPVEIIGELLSERVSSSLIGGEHTDSLIDDIVRKDHSRSVEGHKTFDNLTVENINFENVNGILSSHFVNNNNHSVQLDGDISFAKLVNTENLVSTSKLVNGINTHEEWIHFGQNITGLLEFEQVKARNSFNTKILIDNENIQNSSISGILDEFSGDDRHKSIFIPGNVTVKTLNGHNFESFLRKLCLKSLKCHITILKVNGIVNNREGAKADYLNGLKFPEDYVNLEVAEELLTITGHKEFANITRGYKIFTANKVNNIDLSKIITRSDEQNISGNITFDNLEVASVLKVDGDVNGEGIAKFVPNLGLKETKVIKSNVHFVNLEVQGSIIIKSNFNGTDCNEFFQDFIFKDEENVEINGSKIFPGGFTALKNLHVDSNMINDISLSSFITKNTSQELQVTSVVGIVDFDHLYVTGYYDGENITELNETLVKLSENQTIDSELVFLENLNVGTLALETLNDLNQDQTVNITKNDLSNATDTVFDHLDIEVLQIEGNVIGVIDQFDLKDLQENYLLYTKDQIISEPYFVHKLTLDYLKPNTINGIEHDQMFSYERFTENISDFLLYRNPDVENLNVEGSLNVKVINDRNFDQLLENNVWMKMYNNGSRKILTIDGNVYFETLQIQNLSGANFNEYVRTLVFKNETDVDIEDSIIFENGIKVEKLIETKTLNNVALENVLRKSGMQTLLSPVDILGNVTVVDDLLVEGMVNNVDLKYMSNIFDMRENSTTIKGEVMFHRLSYIHSLIINGTINGKYVEKVKSQLVYTNSDIDLEKDTYFNEMVHVNGNLGITNDVNGILLSDFVSKVVWITQDTDIEGPIRFTHSVECHKFMNVDEELNTHLLFGQNLEENVNKGVYINKGLIKGSFSFDEIAINDNLNTQLINNINMDNIIPLKSDQEIETLELTDVFMFHDTDVGGKVNGVKLLEELKRTAMKNIEQEIPSGVVFLNNVLVEDKLITQKINNKSTSKIVTTNTDQNLTAAYNFNTKCWTDGHLVVHGLVNGINLTSWKNYTMSTNLENSLNLEGQWTVMEDLNLVGPVNGDGIMNGINMTKLVNDFKEKGSYKCAIEKGIFDDYKNLCTDVTYIYENSKNQIYKFKYFEEFQKISLSSSIHYVKHFENQGKHYLLINENQSCHSRLMEFQQNGFYSIRDVHTGIISQVEVSKDNEDLFLVIRGEDSNESVCQMTLSTVVWKLINADLQVLEYFEHQELLQASQVPVSFYGLRHGVVTEFNIDKASERSVRRYRKWDVNEDNISFLPSGLKTGLALRTGKNIIFLNRNDPIEEEDFGLDTEAIIKGTMTMDRNFIVPGRVGGVVAITNVGVKRGRKTMLAVASHKEARVVHRLDLVEIYLDPFKGELFDKIPTYRPSSLTSIEFENGETLLAFMEEQKILQIYEYKGIEGFKHRSSIKMSANQLFLMELPIGDNLTLRKVLGVVHKNEITLLQAVMVGNKIKEGLKCSL